MDEIRQFDQLIRQCIELIGTILASGTMTLSERQSAEYALSALKKLDNTLVQIASTNLADKIDVDQLQAVDERFKIYLDTYAGIAPGTPPQFAGRTAELAEIAESLESSAIDFIDTGGVQRWP